MMYHEAELPSVMVTCFIAISVIFVAAMIGFFFKTKNWKATLAFAGQWLLTCGAFECLYNVVSGRGIHPGMASEGNSWFIGCCGLCWGASILLLLVGIWFLTRQIKTEKVT